MKNRLLLFLLTLSVCRLAAQAPDDANGKAWLSSITANAVSRTSAKYPKAHHGPALYFSQAGNLRVPYLVYVPKAYDPEHATRVVVFLHGAILARDSFQYSNPEIEREPIFYAADRFNVLVVFPFARADFAWGRNEEANEHIMTIIAQVAKTYHVDRSKVYIGGISMGGNATYWFVNNKANEFAGFYAFSSLPYDGVRFDHITEARPLYTMNAKDDRTFAFEEVQTTYNKYKNKIPGWHFNSVESGGHRFIYGNGGRRHIESLMSDLMGIPLFEH